MMTASTWLDIGAPVLLHIICERLDILCLHSSAAVSRPASFVGSCSKYGQQQSAQRATHDLQGGIGEVGPRSIQAQDVCCPKLFQPLLKHID